MAPARGSACPLPSSGRTSREPRRCSSAASGWRATSGFLTRLRGQEDDTRVLVEWMEAGRGRGEGPRRRPGRSRADDLGGRVPEDARGRARPRQRDPHHQRRGGGHGEPGLGGDAPAHVPALVRPPRVQARHHRHPGRRGSGHQERDRARERGIRLRLPLRGGRSPPAGAHQPLRLRGTAAHLLRLRLRLAGDRGGHQDRGPGQGHPRRHLSVERGGRPARQRHRLRGAHHAHAERHRRLLPERAQPDPQPRGRDEGPEVAPLRPGAAEAAGQARRGRDRRRRTSRSAARSAPTSSIPTSSSRTIAPSTRSATSNRVLDGDIDDLINTTLVARAKGTLGPAAAAEDER